MPKFVCPQCGIDYDLPPYQAGRKARCGNCKAKSIVVFEQPSEAPTVVLPVNEQPQARVRFVPPAQELVTPVFLGLPQSRRFRIDGYGIATIVLLCLLMITLFAIGFRTRHRPVAEIPADDRAVNHEPTEEEVYQHCCDLIRDELLNEESAKFPKNGKTDRNPHMPRWSVSGIVKAETRGGTFLTQDWYVALEWIPETRKFAPQWITLGKKTIYRSPELEKTFRKVFYSQGNEVGDLPEDIAKEIRNAQAAVSDAIKSKMMSAFSEQWPDDPSRREFKVRLDDQGEWEITGKIELLNGRPRQTVFAIVTKNSHVVTFLKLDSRVLIRDGSPTRD